jgi:DNA-binding transcriptional regulator LsrR (DeoR family)
VHQPLRRNLQLEQEMQERLGLKIVRVSGHDQESDVLMLRQLGILGARLVEELLYDNITIGMAWGRGVYEVVNSIRSGACVGAHVIQMIGSLGSVEMRLNGQDLSQRLARALIGYYTPLSAPLIVPDEATCNALRRDPQIQGVFEQFNNIELALVGIGTLDPEFSNIIRAGYLTEEQLIELEQYGAVGDVCALHFDLYGNLVEVPLNQRIMGIDAATLAKIPMKIGVAGGAYKVLPIIGASRAGLIDVLVTDELTAVKIIGILKKMSWREQTYEVSSHE